MKLSHPKKNPASTDYRWYLTPEITLTRAFILVFVSSLFCLGMYHSGWGVKFENAIARKAEYQIRNAWNKNPILDERIKIYGMGDSTVDYLQATDLNLKQWAELLKAMEPSHPKAVFIDKIFGIPDGLEGAAYFNETIKNLTFPVIVGVFLTENPIGKRPTFEFNRPLYDEINYSGQVKRGKSIFAYGPHPTIRDAFKKIGHLNYYDGFFVKPLEYPQPEKIIPEAALLLADQLTIDNDTLTVDGARVQLTGNDLMRVNWIPPSVLAKQTFRLAGLVEKIRNKEAITTLPRDGVIVILPGMTTGDSDIQPGPFGLVPGGYIQVSLINSVLTGQFLSKPVHPYWFFLFGAVSSLLFVLPLGALQMWGGFFALNVGAVFAGLYLFSYRSTEISWFWFVISFSVSALLIFVERMRVSDSKARKLREALSGSISQAQLQHLLSHSRDLELNPTEQLVSMVFIDIAGFSRAVEKQAPDEAFRFLKEILTEITSVVHAYGGVVDKTYGDGMLCFFGYNYGLDVPHSNHAEQAVKCAIEIQKRNAERIINHPDRPVYPLRIGVNTDAVYIGDFGSAQRIDLTLIGHGVNIAKRLEAACDNHRIMMGEGTKKRITAEKFVLDKRLIQIKHSSSLFDAYECDPLSAQLEKQLDQVFFQQSGLERRERRDKIPEEIKITLSGPNGSGRVVDFSPSGFGALFTPYLGRGVNVAVSISSPDGILEKRLETLGLVPILCDVRWGKKVSEGYLLGFQAKNHTEQQNSRLVEELQKYLQEKTTKIAI